MYLEISDRQTGKTNRLINQIYRDKQNYDIQILMGINHISLKQIKSAIPKNNKVKICLSYDKLKQTIMGNSNKKIRLYVDEFMFSTAFSNNFDKIKEIFPELLWQRIFFFIYKFC